MKTLQKFVESFEVEDDVNFEGHPIPYYRLEVQSINDRSLLLNNILAKFDMQIPVLYRSLLLSYGWHSSYLNETMQSIRINPNLFVTNYEPWVNEIVRTVHLNSSFENPLGTIPLSNGFVPFGKGPNDTVDPLCFDMRGLDRSGRDACPVVVLDHEWILLKEKIWVKQTIAKSFEEFVLLASG